MSISRVKYSLFSRHPQTSLRHAASCRQFGRLSALPRRRSAPQSDPIQPLHHNCPAPANSTGRARHIP
eukprot:3757897-Rhodomonas_salina.1